MTSSSSRQSSNTKSTAGSKAATQQADPTANWKPYSNSAGQYSLKYPTSWSTASDPSQCGSDTLLLGCDAKSAGSCDKDGAGQISISATEGDSIVSNNELAPETFTDITKKVVTVDGVQGEVMSGKNKVGYDTPSGSIPAGTLDARYLFYTNGRTYMLDYIQAPSYPDVLSGFNVMVAKTLQFHS